MIRLIVTGKSKVIFSLTRGGACWWDEAKRANVPLQSMDAGVPFLYHDLAPFLYCDLAPFLYCDLAPFLYHDLDII